MDPVWLWIALGAVVLFGALAGTLAQRKNRDVYAWVAGGVLLNVVALIILAALPRREVANPRTERVLLRTSVKQADILSRSVQALLLRGPLYWILVALTLLLILVSLVMIFLAPIDKTLGISQKIFYIHVPSAWTSFMSFGFVFLGSILFLWQRKPLWDDLGRAAAEVGFVLCTLMLVTGSLWGRAAWGPDFGYWTWDPRLTSSFFLWLIYVAYLLLRSFALSPHRGALFGAILGLVGLPNIYFIHIAVEKFGGMHPEAIVVRPEGPNMPPQMVYTLLVSITAFTLLAFAMIGQRMRVAALERGRA